MALCSHYSGRADCTPAAALLEVLLTQAGVR